MEGKTNRNRSNIFKNQQLRRDISEVLLKQCRLELSTQPWPRLKQDVSVIHIQMHLQMRPNYHLSLHPYFSPLSLFFLFSFFTFIKKNSSHPFPSFISPFILPWVTQYLVLFWDIMLLVHSTPWPWCLYFLFAFFYRSTL